MSTNWLIALILGLIIIIYLAIYAGKLLSQVRNQKEQQASALKKQKLALNQHDTKILNSVLIIARAMQEEQCDYSEGSWRLAVLLDSLKTTSELDQQFPAIFKLYEAIKHLSILDERKALDKKQRMQQDLERMKIEAELHPKIIEDLKLLHQYANERISMLKTQ